MAVDYAEIERIFQTKQYSGGRYKTRQTFKDLRGRMLDTLPLNSSPSLAHTTHSGCCYVVNNKKEDECTVDAPEFMTNEFRMHHFKIDNCQKQQPHDWTTCPFAHAGEKARRRDPARYKYAAIACIDMKNNGQCPRGDDCPYAHNVFEYWMHPTRYRTQVCHDGQKCKRQICFFAHRLEELRIPPRKPGFPPEWHKGRKHKNRNTSGRKTSLSPKKQLGKGLSEPIVNSKSIWHDPIDQTNNNGQFTNDEFFRNACLNAHMTNSMDHTNSRYTMHDLVSASQQLTNAVTTPFSSLLAMQNQNPGNIHFKDDEHCSALLNETQTTLGIADSASKLKDALNALNINAEWNTEQLTQSSSEYAACTPVIHTAFSGAHMMNLDMERQLLQSSLEASSSMLMEPTLHEHSLSPPRHVRLDPETAPFPGIMGSDQDSPPATQLNEFPSLCIGSGNPLSYCPPPPPLPLSLGEGMFSNVSHEHCQF